VDRSPTGNHHKGLEGWIVPQRGTIIKPRVARNELPWDSNAKILNPNGLASWRATNLGFRGANATGATQRRTMQPALGLETSRSRFPGQHAEDSDPSELGYHPLPSGVGGHKWPPDEDERRRRSFLLRPALAGLPPTSPARGDYGALAALRLAQFRRRRCNRWRSHHWSLDIFRCAEGAKFYSPAKRAGCTEFMKFGLKGRDKRILEKPYSAPSGLFSLIYYYPGRCPGL